jgi:transaldolase / glucose-6-phosphate isomerase
MNLLGWMRAPEETLAQWDDLVALAAGVKADGLGRTLVCGMGGSSLVADVLAETFRKTDLHVLDSTNPAAVRDAGNDAELARTLFVISSKSGNTVETLAFCRHFLARAAPKQFVAITETDSVLAKLARERGFRATIPHPPGVGGRYSALTAIGMFPAALGGIDGREILTRTRQVDIAGAKALGRRIGETAKAGRDKLCLSPPPSIAGLAYWIEQLIAESSGKDGRGVVPVVHDPVGVDLDDMQAVRPAEFSADPLDLGIEFLRWEYATAALCDALGVNAFDQPDVEEAKRLARAELEGRGGSAPAKTMSPAELRAGARPGDYLAILAYVPPTPSVYAKLQELRAAWGRWLRCATTLGFGPRYLHSTGQLHKGGPPSGLFLVITTDIDHDIPIPEMGTTFGALHHAQARGDVRALLARGRRVSHVHLSNLGELSQLRP